MKFTSQDIKNHEFTKSFRGFDPVGVNDFLTELATCVDESAEREEELTKKITDLESQLKTFKSMEHAIQQTFMQAQETSGKAIESARKEAQLIIQEAELKASQILDKAHTDLTELKERVTILKAKKDSLVSRLKMLLNSELDLIKALEVDEELQAHERTPIQQQRAKEKDEIEDIIKSLDD